MHTQAASAEDVAEAVELVARVQREAALDVDGSGWGTDLDDSLAEVTLTDHLYQDTALPRGFLTHGRQVLLSNHLLQLAILSCNCQHRSTLCSTWPSTKAFSGSNF